MRASLILTTLLLGFVLVTGISPAADTSAADKAPHLVFLVSDEPSNYEAARTIPVFAGMLKERYGCECTVIQGEGEPGAFRFAGLEVLKKADLLVIFFRRRAISPEQYKLVRDYLAAGRPLVGVRTANHAFSVNDKVAEGYEKWWEFVPEVLGCKNRGYGSSKLGADVSVVAESEEHSILEGVDRRTWHTNGCLYLVAPMIDREATVLLSATSEDKTEPVAWTRMYGKSRVFYTSLGYPDDFEMPQFRTLLTNGIFWALDKPVPAK